MHLSAPSIEHAVSALRAILPLEAPADAVLSRHFREHPQLGAKERAFVAECAFGVLRRKRLLEHFAGRATPRRLLLAWLVKLKGFGVRELEPFVSSEEREWLRQLKAAPAEPLPLAVEADFPDWLVHKLQQFMNDAEIMTLARGLQQPAPLDLRVNTLLAGRNEVLQALQSEGMDAQATPWSPMGIRLKDKPALNKHALFLSGKFEVQDEGSQLLGLLLAPKRNDMVVDFCAGAGGKTLMLGALMNSQGRLYAWDVSEKRRSEERRVG